MPEPTARPWNRDPESPTISSGFYIEGPSQTFPLVEVYWDDDEIDQDEAEANTDLIVRAVNSHDALVKLAEHIVADHKLCSCPRCREAQAALKLVKGEK